MRPRRLASAAVLAVAGLAATVVPALADSVEVYDDAHTPSGNGPAVSVFGCATSDYGLLAVSGTGCADSAFVGVSGTGPAGHNNPACNAPCNDVSISGTNCSRAFYASVAGDCAYAAYAVSVLGDAHAHDRFDFAPVGTVPDLPGAAVSVFGDAHGPTAVSVFGDASSRPATIWLPTGPVTYQGLAVSVTGTADDAP